MAYKYWRVVFTNKNPWRSLRQLEETRWRIKQGLQRLYYNSLTAE